MTRIVCRFALLLFFCLLAVAAQPVAPRAQEPLSYSESLFWRLQHPSGHHGFLFGTLHSPDRRLVPFVDYLRSYMRDVDVVYFEHTVRDLERTFDATLSLVEEPLRNRLAPALYDRVMAHFDEVHGFSSGLEYAPIFYVEGWMLQEPSYEHILDRRLEIAARRQGSPTRSLETTEERLRLIRVTETLDANDIIASAFYVLEQYPDPWSEILERYIDMDLNWIMETAEWGCDETTDADWCGTIDVYGEAWIKDIALRDRAMASRIDSAMENQSIFAAVGAAHLPGDEGLLALLVDKGFAVTPVHILLPRNDLPQTILTVSALCLAGFAVFRIVVFVRRRTEHRRVREAEAGHIDRWQRSVGRLSDPE